MDIDVKELLEERISECHEWLKNAPADDPKRKNVVDELTQYDHDYQEALKREMERNNANVQNDISEARLQLEFEKNKEEAKANRSRNLVTILTTGLLGLLSVGEIWLSYNMEFIQNKLPTKWCANVGRNLTKFIKR